MRKIGVGLLVAVIAAGALSGCGVLLAGTAGGVLGSEAAKSKSFNPAKDAETGASTVYHDTRKGVTNAYNSATGD